MEKPENISVSRKELEYLATFECERPRYTPDSSTIGRIFSCEERNKKYYGMEKETILCNSCWVRNDRRC